ncbi:MAG: hypothetical protein U0L10_08325, partial [Lachnospiraceae bacterium]|nr:hypothetical protein [Lachnospiraceae bacterium]
IAGKFNAGTDAIAGKFNEAAKAVRENVADYQSRIADTGEGTRVEIMRRMEQLQKEHKEWVKAFNKRRHWLMRHVFRSNPEMKHMEYEEALEELREILKEGGE